MSENDSSNLGFVLTCGDGQSLQISTSQAMCMSTSCEYFNAVFAHGTLETNNRILSKPDWSIETATSIVELITKDKTISSNESEFRSLSSAVDQILFKIRVHSPKGFGAKQSKKLDANAVLKLLDGTSPNESSTSSWTIELSENPLNMLQMEATRVTNDKRAWENLLEIGIIIGPPKGAFLIQKATSESLDTKDSELSSLSSASGSHFEMCTEKIEQERIDAKALFQVQSSRFTLPNSIFKVCDELYKHKGPNAARNRKIFSVEEFSIRIPCCSIEKFNGTEEIRQYIHKKSSNGYYLAGEACVCHTFLGSFKDLNAVMNSIPEELVQNDSIFGRRCSLRISAPSTTTVKNAIAASQKCDDNPCTMGVDIVANAYFAVKTINDMKIMLSYLAGEMSDVKKEIDGFKLVELDSNSKGVF